MGFKEGLITLEGQYDNIDLINIVLMQITRQKVITEEDRRVINHLQESLFQLNLKKSKYPENEEDNE